MRRRSKSQARKSPRADVRSPVTGMALPDGLGDTTSLHQSFRPLTATRHGNKYLALVKGGLSRQVDIYAMTAAQFTAVRSANTHGGGFILKWGFPELPLPQQR